MYCALAQNRTNHEFTALTHQHILHYPSSVKNVEFSCDHVKQALPSSFPSENFKRIDVLTNSLSSLRAATVGAWKARIKWSLLFKHQLWQPEGCGHAAPPSSWSQHKPAGPLGATCQGDTGGRRPHHQRWWWGSRPPDSPWRPHAFRTHSPDGQTLGTWLFGCSFQVHTQGLARPSHCPVRTKGTRRWTGCFC